MWVAVGELRMRVGRICRGRGGIGRIGMVRGCRMSLRVRVKLLRSGCGMLDLRFWGFGSGLRRLCGGPRWCGEGEFWIEMETKQ